MIQYLIEIFRGLGIVLVICIGVAGYMLILLKRHFSLLKGERLSDRYGRILQRYGRRG